MGKMFITRDSYGKAMANLALDVLKANVEQELFNEINMLEAIEVIENYVANSKLVNVKEVKVSGKVIAEKMKANETLKPFAKLVACKEKVTRDDLEKFLPDYISGGDITKLFNEEVK